MSLFENLPSDASINQVPPQGLPSSIVALINVSSDEVVIHGEFTETVILSSFLDSSSSDVQTHLFLVEDLSPGLIELLGAHFDVDPTFFGSHIYALNQFTLYSVSNTASSLQTQSFLPPFTIAKVDCTVSIHISFVQFCSLNCFQPGGS